MDLANFSFEILTFLFVIAIIAGFIDTLVGGGGLLAVPALLLSGIPPIYVLGTNKFQGSMGTGIATFLLFRKKKLNWETIKYLMLASFIGSIIGGVIVQFIDTELLSFVIPIVLVVIAIYFIIFIYSWNGSRFSGYSSWRWWFACSSSFIVKWHSSNICSWNQ